MVVLAMIGLVLLQRSEGGALGIGGGGSFMSGRSAGNVLTRSTAVLAVAFFATSIGLALLAKLETRPSDIFNTLPGQAVPAAPVAPAPAPAGAPSSAQDLLQQLGGGGTGDATPVPSPQADAVEPPPPAAEVPPADAAAPPEPAPVP
jgi:preprotein translocase subunit SecG